VTPHLKGAPRTDLPSRSAVVDGPVNADMFAAFVDQVLTPELRHGDIVVKGNLSSHKNARIRLSIKARGALPIYLPPYSPDLNPIEMIFSKVKQTLRGLAFRTQHALWTSMQSVLDRVTPSGAVNCFAHCGYSLRKD
jgi:transposase